MLKQFKSKSVFIQLWLLLLCSVILLSGCSGPAPRLKNLMKSDIDMVADAHQASAETLLQELTKKLYLRNPRELSKGQGGALDARIDQLFSADRTLDFAEINQQRGVPAVLLALDPEYTGDRVFSLMVGLLSMVRHSYNDLPEFFLLDSLDPQKLYNSARNIEILVWRLNNRRDSAGNPLLLTNSSGGEEQNLSFERLFGKLIAQQDMMALIAAEKWNRAINQIVHGAASAVFLPVGF